MRILMIEDHAPFAELMVHMLEGLDIEVAGSLAAAKACLETKRYGLILVDLGLPDSSGLGTLRALQRYKTPKVVLTTRFDLSSEATALGCVDYVTKCTLMSDVYERIMFNVSKAQCGRKPFAPKVFDQIKVCLSSARGWVDSASVGAELTAAV